MKSNSAIIMAVIAVVVIGGSIFLFNKSGNAQPSALDGFAQCLKDKSAVFYGAYWCPNCQTQKKMFGSAAKLLNYVECSTPDGKAQLQVCVDKKIEKYPTWEFIDGSRTIGTIPLETLAEKTSCQLPQQ